MTKEEYEIEVLKLTSIPQVLGLSLTYIMSLEEELQELKKLEEWLELNSIDALNTYYDSLERIK